MSDHEVQISLPIASVRRAWLRYLGADGVAGESHDEGWSSNDERALTATFTSDADALTTVAVRGPDASEADNDPGSTLIEGFVAYVEAVHSALAAEPGSTVGAAPVGPDGTSHMEDQPTALGTDGQPTGDAGQWSGQTP